MLVAYFSYAENADLPEGVDVSSGASIQIWNDETTGNTGVVAAMIADTAGADMFSIRTAEKYPDTYDATIDQGQEEQNEEARPELASHIENLDSYDVIFLGFPVWWYVAPTILNTFLEAYDFTGKTIVLFATSGGSGLGKSAAGLQVSAPGAKIMDGRMLNGRLNEAELKTWVDGLKL